jgi:hypothetical protein
MRYKIACRHCLFSHFKPIRCAFIVPLDNSLLHAQFIDTEALTASFCVYAGEMIVGAKKVLFMVGLLRPL